MKQSTAHDAPILSEQELELLEAEKQRLRSRKSTTEIYGTHTHVADPTPGHRSDTFRTSLVRPRRKPRSYRRSIALIMILVGISIGAVASFALTHNPMNLVFAGVFFVAALTIITRQQYIG